MYTKRQNFSRLLAIIIFSTSIILMFSSSDVFAVSEHHCSEDARKQAAKLLEFHFGPDDRIAIDESVTVLTPLRNPVDKEQQFDVLEVWGYIYKGRYRMRLIYAQIPSECVLMGQEILEHARL
jgi:hypothetical protein